MDLNVPFLTGLSCGFVLGISALSLPRLFGTARAKASAIRKFASGKEYKIVLVVRTDLNMTKGKIASQCAHAAVRCFEEAQTHDPDGLQSWQTTGQAKIALKTDSVDEINQIVQNAKQMGIITAVIHDAGRTQIAPNSVTVLGVGPAPKDVVDQVTGHLKLL